MSPEECDIDGLIAAFKPLILTAHRTVRARRRPPRSTVVRFGVDEPIDMDDVGCRCHVCAPCPYCLVQPEEQP